MYRRSFLFGLISIPWPWAAKKPEPQPEPKPDRPVMIAVLGGTFPSQSTVQISPVDVTIVRNPYFRGRRGISVFRLERQDNLKTDFAVSHQVLVGTPEEIAEHFKQQILTAALEMERHAKNLDLPMLTAEAVASVGYKPGCAVLVPFV